MGAGHGIGKLYAKDTRLSLCLLSTQLCKIRTEQRSQCGDGLIQGTEGCDDGVLNGAACPYGLQSCQSWCRLHHR